MQSLHSRIGLCFPLVTITITTLTQILAASHTAEGHLVYLIIIDVQIDCDELHMLPNSVLYSYVALLKHIEYLYI